MSWADLFSSVVSTPTDFKGNLDRANFAVQDKLGKFLSSGQRILTLRDQARPFTASTVDDATQARANALIAQGNSLLNSIRGIQTRAMSAAGQAADYRAKMETDPFWKNITTSPITSLGFGAYPKAKEALGQITTLISALYSINKEMDAHMKQVEAYASDVSTLSSFAQSKGFSGTAKQVGGFFGGVVEKETTILTVGAVLIGGFLLWNMSGGSARLLRGK